MKSFNLRPIFGHRFVCPSSMLWELSTVLQSISLLCTGEIALIIDLGLIDMFSANQKADIVACILLRFVHCLHNGLPDEIKVTNLLEPVISLV